MTIPVQGWKQFLTSRKRVLDAYDRARDQARAHMIETFHGRVVEAEFREWLGGFLPGRYGVTSGYVVSQGLSAEERLPHYDVIVYDSLNAPSLWVERNPDTSPGGESRAIPCEHVLAVLEVKSSFDRKSIKEGVRHLSELKPVLGEDEPGCSYRKNLPADFISGLIFVELRRKNEFKSNLLDDIAEARRLRGFTGGLILRAEGTSEECSGRIRIVNMNEPLDNPNYKAFSLFRSGLIAHVVSIKDDLHSCATVHWSTSEFAHFAFDFLAGLRGEYDPRVLSSLHGLERPGRQRLLFRFGGGPADSEEFDRGYGGAK